MTGYGIAGRVLAAASMTALSGISVTLTGTRSLATTTDANGAYAFVDLVRNGDYTVTPASSGYTFSPESRFFYALSGDETASDFYATPVAANRPPTCR